MLLALVHFFSRCHRPLLIAAVLGAAASLMALLAVGLHEEYSVASFVGSDNREFAVFQDFVDTFASSEPALIAVKGPHALDERTLACVADINERVRNLPAVGRAAALTQLGFGRSLWLEHPLVKGVLVSHDHKTATVVMQMLPESDSGVSRRQTVGDLRRIVDHARRQYTDLEIILTGPYVTMLEMFEFVRQDLKVFSGAVALLMAGVLYWITGSWRIAAYATGVAAAAVLCTLGLTIALGVNMSLTTQMTVIMLAVLAVAGCVHLSVGFREVTESRSSSRRAWRCSCLRVAALTLHKLAAPCTAVILTSAAGFGSVCISDIQPIRSFGAIMVVGLLLALAWSLAGVFVLRTGAESLSRRSAWNDWLTRKLSRIADHASRKKRLVVVVFLMAAAVLAVPIPGLSFESDFVRNFRKNSAVRRGYEFIERNLAPLGAIEVIARRPAGGSVVTVQAMQACDTVARRVVEEHEPVKKAVSLLDVMRVSGGEVPSSQIEVDMRFKAARTLLPALFGPELLSNFLTADESALRITLLAREGASVWHKIEMADGIRGIAEEAFGSGYQVTVTGLYPFYATLIAGLLRDQNVTFALTLVAVFAVSAGLLRSWKLAAVGMIPNLFPMVACLGLMGWLNVPINMATSMMLAISLGIAVDDTIHYLYRFRRELQFDGNPFNAVARCHRSVGQACVFTTVVITGGFWILCFSRFLPTAYFGALIGLTMLSALAADLVLLPALLVSFRPRNWGRGGSARG